MPREAAARPKLSLASKDAVESGLFSSGPAKVTESIFTTYTYGNGTKAEVWLVVFEREGEKPYEQPYSIGKGWKIAKDGLSMTNTAGLTSLPKNCNAMQYLVPSLERAGCPAEVLESGDPSQLTGLEVVVSRVPQEKRQIKGQKADDKERTILVIEEITSAPWDDAKPARGTKVKAKAKPEPEDDDDEEEEEDEKPAPKAKGKTKPAPADDDDDDDEAPPAKGKGAAKGKAKPEPEPADDDADDLLEEGAEALIAALEEQSPIKLADVEAAVRAQLKGNPKAKAIAAHMGDPDTLEVKKLGWTFDGKRVRLE